MKHNETVDIGSRIEPFFDDFLIDTNNGTELMLHHPERREAAFVCDAPWESGVAFFNSIIQEDDRILLFYRASTDRSKGEDFQNIALAESFDRGYSFVRPKLGIVTDPDIDSDNNLIAVGEMPLVPPPFRDTNPDCREDQRYKGFCSKWRKLYALCSADGIRWRLMQDEPIDMSGTFDTVNTAFWDPRIGEYRSFTRFFRDADLDAEETDLLGADNTAVRSIQSSRSPDFIHWSEPIAHRYRDEASNTQLYTNATLPCPGAGHIYLAFPNRYVQHRVPDPEHGRPGVNDALFMCSREAVTWTRYLEAWVRPGLDPYNWTERSNYPTWGIVESSETEWSMYISEYYRRNEVPAQLRRLSIRPFGFVSLHAGYEAGTMTTVPFFANGEDLKLNFSTSAAGSIRVSVLDEAGNEIEGYRADDMEELYGDSLSRVVRWKDGKRIGGIPGSRSSSEPDGGGSSGPGNVTGVRDPNVVRNARPIRLRFELSDADLFAMQITR